jgi:short-subunit dehydrogenase involved in D-alanine esterification of teichoic acids
VAEVFGAHPDIDFVLLNSGIQRGFDFSKPSNVDLSILDEELLTNYTAPIHLTKALLPYLQKQEIPTCIAYTTSSLAIVPLPRCPDYCATKAALHSFIMCLREQLKHGPGKVKVIEILPPAVQTELHDEKHQPDIKGGGTFGVPLAEYNANLWKQLGEGKEEISYPLTQRMFDSIEPKRKEFFDQFVAMIAKTSEGRGQ